MNRIGMKNERNGLGAHILPTSANLVGACMCAIPLVKLLHRGNLSIWIDKGLALASLLFLTSAGLSYLSMRHSGYGSSTENLAEIIFLAGLFTVFSSLMLLSWGFA